MSSCKSYIIRVLCRRCLVIIVGCRYTIYYIKYNCIIVVYHFTENGCEASWIPNHSVARIVLLRGGEGGGGWEFIRRCMAYNIYQNKRYDHDRHFGRVPTAADQPIVGPDNMEISFPLRLPPTSGRPSLPGAISGPPTTYRPTVAMSRPLAAPVYIIYIMCIYVRAYIYIVYPKTKKNSHTQVRDFLCFPCSKTTTVVFFLLFFF